MYSLSKEISFTRNQINEFGILTGDNGPIHSIDGIVQGGLIVSCLPKILTDLLAQANINEGKVYASSVSMKLESRFRTKLPADKLVTVEFTFQNPKAIVSKIVWKIYDETSEYCSGKWIVRKFF